MTLIVSPRRVTTAQLCLTCDTCKIVCASLHTWNTQQAEKEEHTEGVTGQETKNECGC